MHLTSPRSTATSTSSGPTARRGRSPSSSTSVPMALAVPLVNAAVRRVADRRPARGRVGAARVVHRRRPRLPGLGDRPDLPRRRRLVGVVLRAVAGRRLRPGHGLSAVLVAAGVRLEPRGPLDLGVLGLAALGVLVMTRPFDDTPTSEWWHPLLCRRRAAARRDRAARGTVVGFFDWRPLAFVRTLGYGVYLVHEPVMRFLGHLGVLPRPTARPLLLDRAPGGRPEPGAGLAGARTVEPAGLRLLATMDKQGRRRDYYESTSGRARRLPGAGEAVPGSGQLVGCLPRRSAAPQLEALLLHPSWTAATGPATVGWGAPGLRPTGRRGGDGPNAGCRRGLPAWGLIGGPAMSTACPVNPARHAGRAACRAGFPRPVRPGVSTGWCDR